MDTQEIHTEFKITDIRDQFPILSQEVNGFPLAYFDNAATTQKPSSVIEALNSYNTGYNSNIHRGAHALAEKATSAYEDARIRVQQFIGAREAEEVIFTRGTTEGINLVASSLGRKELKEGDELTLEDSKYLECEKSIQSCESAGFIFAEYIDASAPASKKPEPSLKEMKEAVKEKKAEVKAEKKKAGRPAKN